MNAPASKTEVSESEARQLRELKRIIYLQAVFLGLTYVIGVWQTLTMIGASLISPAVIAHGIAAGGFTILTGAVGLIAGAQGERKVSVLNFGLFLVSVLGGATGFSFLGNPYNIPGMNLTNMAMITVIGIGMPISGYSLTCVSERLAGRGYGRDVPPARLTELAILTIAVTVVTGASVLSTPAANAMLVPHILLAVLSISLVIGVVVQSIRKGLVAAMPAAITKGFDLSLLALASTAAAAVTGTLAYAKGGIAYSVGMAEVAAFSYGFLILLAGVGISQGTTRTPKAEIGFDASRRSFIRGATAVSVLMAAVGLTALLRSITEPPPPTNQLPLSFPRYRIANLSDVQENQPLSFNYPLDTEPNILVKLGTRAAGGVGPNGDIVAFSQICQHLGCIYGFQPEGTSPECNSGYRAPGPAGYCCCHGSIFDLTKGGAVIGGPSPRPVPQVLLETDSSGNIYAVGMKPPTIFGHDTGSNDVSNDLQGGSLVT